MIIEIQSARLVLSPITMMDLEKIHALHSLPVTDQYNTLGIPAGLEETKSIIKDWVEKNTNGLYQNFVFKIESKETKDFIGLIAINLGNEKFKIAEVWYKLLPNFWNNGYATEALNRILEFGFKSLGLHRIEAGCAVGNLGSIRVLEKVGMTREGRKRKVLPLKTGWTDNFSFAILEEDYNSN